jgi:hypothetical protein
MSVDSLIDYLSDDEDAFAAFRADPAGVVGQHVELTPDQREKMASKEWHQMSNEAVKSALADPMNKTVW